MTHDGTIPKAAEPGAITILSGPPGSGKTTFENLGALEKHVFDSTVHSVEATVAHVRTGVRIGQFSL